MCLQTSWQIISPPMEWWLTLTSAERNKISGEVEHYSTKYLTVNNSLSSKKSFGVVQFKETMAVKRALQNPRHYINEQFVEIALSKFAIEAFLSPSTLWVWDLAWTITKEDLIQYFSKFGKVYRAMHIYNPITGN